MERLAQEHKPKLIVAGASRLRAGIDFERFREIADGVGAMLMADMAHYAGLVAAGVYPNPVPHAHFVTSTTHKTLRGPRGGLILGHGRDTRRRSTRAIFPGMQGGPLMHVIAAKAVAFKEAMAPEFSAYQQQVIDNARVMAEVLQERGLRIVSRPHRLPHVPGRPAAEEDHRQGGRGGAGAAHITVNKNAIPNDPEKPSSPAASASAHRP